MRQKLINSQLNNWTTYQYYLRKMLTLSENVFIFENMPDMIDIAYLNKQLVRKGSVAFFKDEVLGVLALPYTILGKLDVYGRPVKIQVIGQNGYTKVCKKDEFVIMYDNNGRYPLFIDIIQSAERLALVKRTTDINIAQQKTPRIFKTPTEKERSMRDLLNNVDGLESSILTYDDINLDDTTAVLAPAPYVADKLDIHKENEWSEFLQHIGVSNLSVQKKERNITDEVNAMMGGTIASRFSRFEPRKEAVKKINEMFDLDISVRYYDGEPSDKIEEDDQDGLLDVSVSNSEI